MELPLELSNFLLHGSGLGLEFLLDLLPDQSLHLLLVHRCFLVYFHLGSFSGLLNPGSGRELA